LLTPLVYLIDGRGGKPAGSPRLFQSLPLASLGAGCGVLSSQLLRSNPAASIPSFFPMFTFLHMDESHRGHLQTGRYRNDRLAVKLIADGQDYAMLSVNIPETELGPDEFLFKTYSENEGLLEAMLSAGVVAVVSTKITAAGPLPVCRLLS
jgi:hypothetical protein